MLAHVLSRVSSGYCAEIGRILTVSMEAALCSLSVNVLRISGGGKVLELKPSSLVACSVICRRLIVVVNS